MKKWVKIPDVLFFQEGPGVRNTQYTSTGVKLLNVANLVDGKIDLSTSDRFISEDEAYGKYKHFMCDEGDFVVASSGIKVEYIDKKMGFIEKSMLPLCMNTSTIRFKVLDTRELNIRYFMYYLKSSHFKEQLSRYITGSAQLNYGPSHLKKMVMPIVSICEQQEIISLLDETQVLIELRKQQLEKLDTLIKARFVEMFGDPVVNPKGWEKRPLSEEAEIRIGPFGSLLHKEDYITGGHALINPSHIIDGRITPDNDLTLTDDKYEELAPYHLIEGDVVMGRRGEMGRCAVVDRPGLLCGTGSLLIRTKGDLSADYIQKIISFPSFKRTIEDMAVGQTMPNLNVPIVSAFQIIKPPKTVQEQYYAFVSQIDKSKAIVQKALTEAQLLFDSLMQKYFG